MTRVIAEATRKAREFTRAMEISCSGTTWGTHCLALFTVAIGGVAVSVCLPCALALAEKLAARMAG